MLDGVAVARGKEAKHLDTPRLVADDTQKTVWKWEQQEPFGVNAANEDPDADTVAFEFNLRFPGQYFDKEINAHYNYFRDYDPAIGRYVQSDPIGLRGGLNTYAYVHGNPVLGVDQSGLLNITIQGGLTAIAGVAGTSASAQYDYGGGLYYNIESGQAGGLSQVGVGVGGSGSYNNGESGPANYGGLFGGFGFSVGLVSGGAENIEGRSQNLYIQPPGPVGIVEFYGPNNEFQGIGISFGPSIGAGLSQTNTRISRFRKPRAASSSECRP